MKTSPSTDARQPRIAFLAGSFDPFTRGHEKIVKRGLEIFDEIVVGIGINPEKIPLFSPEARKTAISNTFADEPRVRVVAYEGYTVDAAQVCGAHFLLRGVRTGADFEYEKKLAQFNFERAGIETVLLPALPELASISSTQARHLLAQGQDISHLLPTS